MPEESSYVPAAQLEHALTSHRIATIVEHFCRKRFAELVLEHNNPDLYPLLIVLSFGERIAET